MSFWAYLLRCGDGSFYTGHTDDLERRIAEHSSGAIPGYTAKRRPVVLMWSEEFQTRDEAKAAEHRIKPWSRDKKEALIAGDWQALRVAALPPAERAARAPRLRSGQTGFERGATNTEGHVSEPHPLIPSEVEGQPPRKSSKSDAPAIVLVRPQLGENIGKAARAMLNFGLTDLRLVSPRDGWPNPAAGPAASGADVVLAEAQVFETVAEAVADCAHVYATTVRRRGVTKPVLTPEQAAAAMRGAAGRSAILFGAERAGLETEEVAIARAIVTARINPAFGSLNLAQAVILLAYEWSKHEALAQPPATDLDPPAPQAELDGMIAQLDAMLESAGYFHPPDRAPSTRRTLRTLLTKPGWSAQEVRTLRGVLSALERPRRR